MECTSIERIMIIGGPGTGKTWLARQLALRYGLPVHSVDEEVWDPSGDLRAAGDIDARVRQLALRDEWIIEGGNSRTYVERVQRADAIIRLVPSLWRRLGRVIRRDGIRLELLRWTLRYDRVIGPKDSLALQAGRETAICIEIRTCKDLQHLLRGEIDAF